jgi:hypothetical protein
MTNQQKLIYNLEDVLEDCENMMFWHFWFKTRTFKRNMLLLAQACREMSAYIECVNEFGGLSILIQAEHYLEKYRYDI